MHLRVLDTSAHRLEEPGINPPTFRLVIHSTFCHPQSSDLVNLEHQNRRQRQPSLILCARSPDRPTLKMTEGEASGRGGARGGGGGGGTGAVCPVINAEEYFYFMFSNSFVFYVRCHLGLTIAENRFLKLVKPDKV